MTGSEGRCRGSRAGPHETRAEHLPGVVKRLARIVDVVTLIGLLAPCMKVVGFANLSVNGLDTDDGKLMLGIVVLAGIMMARHAQKPSRKKLISLGLAGLALAALGLYKTIDIHASVNDVNGEESITAATVGCGVYAAMLGGVGILGSALALLFEKQALTTPTTDEFPA